MLSLESLAQHVHRNVHFLFGLLHGDRLQCCRSACIPFRCITIALLMVHQLIALVNGTEEKIPRVTRTPEEDDRAGDQPRAVSEPTYTDMYGFSRHWNENSNGKVECPVKMVWKRIPQFGTSVWFPLLVDKPSLTSSRMLFLITGRVKRGPK
jgi:hypothetical protein